MNARLWPPVFVRDDGAPGGYASRVVALIFIAPLALGITPAIGSTQDSLIRNPQQGATPRPLQPSPTLPAVDPVPAPIPTLPIPAGPPASRSPSLPVGPLTDLPSTPSQQTSPPDGAAIPRSGAATLPLPGADPMRIDPETDPILRLGRTAGSFDAFSRAMGAAVARNPGLGESVAQADEAEAARNEARARQYPTVDLSLTYFNVVSRAFSDDPLNILERSRPRERTDATIRVQQPVLDFGANGDRIRAGNARMQAAEASIDDSTTQIALRGIAAWYNVFGYRALVSLGDAFAADQKGLRAQLDQRVARGYSASGDVAQMDGYIAATAAQLADFERTVSNAEAQYAQLVGAPAPPSLSRAPTPTATIVSEDRARLDAETLPSVTAARLLADAARKDVSGLKADMLPAVTVGVDGGRYGVIETEKDYDVRANVTVSQRLFGGASQRVDQAQARARGASARFERIREEAQRDAAIAWTDVRALEKAKDAVEENYIAARRSRDVLTERFRVSRGSLFDVMSANNNYFNVAVRYIQTVTELDIARYVLLARTGKLLDALAIAPTKIRDR